MSKPTLSYLQSRLEEIQRQIDDLKANANPFGSDEDYPVETILMWRHTYGPHSVRRNTYTFVAIKVAANKWRVRAENLSWDTLCDDYFSEADDGQVFAADHFRKI